MPRNQLHALVRALLKLLLFVSIAEHCATALPTTSQSSPAPFTAPPPPTIAATIQNASSPSSDRSLADLVNSNNNNPEAETTGSGWETLETDLGSPGTTMKSSTSTGKDAEKEPSPMSTSATSIEQQDQPPEVPATTLAFANAVPVPVAGEMGNGNGNGGSGMAFNDATPPYAAVDDNYGK